ncbi:hypothetical protein Golob_001143, partial [Gossypium lobatum]|nr:hypothetical protein [Gossypium lobatum]
MEATRFDNEKFDGFTNFNLWQTWMIAILVQTGLKNKADRQAFVSVASKKQDKKCHYYKKLGHIKAYCYKLQNKMVSESNEEDVAGANLAKESDDDFFLVSTSDSSELTSEWILDSG